jgi:hypothetical protein
VSLLALPDELLYLKWTWTIAVVPVVTVVAGPDVERSAYEVLVVVCAVATFAAPTAVMAAVGTVVGPMVTHDVPLYDLTKSVSVS